MADNNEMFGEYNEYPKNIEFDSDGMKKTSAKMLATVTGISVLIIALSFLMNDHFFYYVRRFGVLCLVVSVGMFVMLLINMGRCVRSVSINRDGFYINDDFYELEGTTVKIAPFLPFAGKADNIYITVKSAGRKKKYWAGCNDDVRAAARRDQMRNELARLSHTIIK